MIPAISTGLIRSPKRVTNEKPMAATIVVTNPHIITITQNCQLVGYISDKSGALTLKMAAKAVAETVNIAPARPANNMQLTASYTKTSFLPTTRSTLA